MKTVTLVALSLMIAHVHAPLCAGEVRDILHVRTITQGTLQRELRDTLTATEASEYLTALRGTDEDYFNDEYSNDISRLRWKILFHRSCYFFATAACAVGLWKTFPYPTKSSKIPAGPFLAGTLWFGYNTLKDITLSFTCKFYLQKDNNILAVKSFKIPKQATNPLPN